MKLHESDTFNFNSEDDQLVLHLSEPHFKLYQRIWRRIRQFYSTCAELIL